MWILVYADLITIPEEILNRKLHFCVVKISCCVPMVSSPLLLALSVKGQVKLQE